MAEILSNDRLAEQLWRILDNDDPRDRLYVYRLQGGKPMKPAVLKCTPFPDLLEHLRDQLGGGDFRLLIRRSDQMILAGTLSIISQVERRFRG